MLHKNLFKKLCLFKGKIYPIEICPLIPITQFNENHANITSELLRVVLESIHKDVC